MDLKSYKNKGVQIASRSFLNFVRAFYPKVLKKKQKKRGLDSSVKPAAYGEIVTTEELVKLKEANSDDEEEEDEDGWINVKHSSDEEEDGNEEGNGMEWEEVEEGEGEDGDDNDNEEEEEEDDESGEGEGEEMEEEGEDNDESDEDGEDDIGEEEGEDGWVEVKQGDSDNDMEEEEEEQPSGTIAGPRNIGEKVDPTDLLGYQKKVRLTLEERLSKVKEGRSLYESKQLGGGSTNKEKERKKNFMMVKHSQRVLDKLKKSLKQQQRQLNKTLKSFKTANKKAVNHRRR